MSLMIALPLPIANTTDSSPNPFVQCRELMEFDQFALHVHAGERKGPRALKRTL
jgi:hypothetical protein